MWLGRGRAARALLTAATLAPPRVLAAREARQFGAATFVAPAGWSLDCQPRAQILSQVRGQDRCLLILSAEEASPSGLTAAFGAAWRALFSTGYRRADQPAIVERVAPGGFHYAVGEGSLEDGRAGGWWRACTSFRSDPPASGSC